MSKKSKKAPAELSFSGALSASIRFLPEDGTSGTSIPEQGRPLLKSNRLFVNLFRVIGNEKYIIFGKMEYIRISNNDTSFSVTMIHHFR